MIIMKCDMVMSTQCLVKILATFTLCDAMQCDAMTKPRVYLIQMYNVTKCIIRIICGTLSVSFSQRDSSFFSIRLRNSSYPVVVVAVVVIIL